MKRSAFLISAVLFLAACDGTRSDINVQRAGGNNNNLNANPASEFDPSKTTFTTRELSAAFRDHNKEANEAYFKKRVTVTGTVRDTDPDWLVLKLDTGLPEDANKDTWILAQGFDVSNRPKLSKFKSGQVVTVNCLVNGNNGMGTIMSACSLP